MLVSNIINYIVVNESEFCSMTKVWRTCPVRTSPDRESVFLNQCLSRLREFRSVRSARRAAGSCAVSRRCRARRPARSRSEMRERPDVILQRCDALCAFRDDIGGRQRTSHNLSCEIERGEHRADRAVEPVSVLLGKIRRPSSPRRNCNGHVVCLSQ